MRLISPALRSFAWLCIVFLMACQSSGNKQPDKTSSVKDITLLFTNDFESAFDPIPAFWREDVEFLGGAAHLATMVDSIREAEEMVFLFDAGDMFTGTLSNRTQGELLMEMMITLRYDAMAIGNHEFDYGWKNFQQQKNRVPFPVLGANIFYKGTDIPFAQPYAIIERDGFRIGVIGVIGQDARSVVIPSNVDGLDFLDPAPVVDQYVKLLHPDVDLIVLLTHQGKTGPMQTDQEAHPEIWRDFEEDIALAGAVKDIDVHFSGHAHRGILEPFVHPETGTLIMQTFGHATHLGFLKLQVDTDKGLILKHEGGLLDVESNRYPPHPVMQAKIESYRERYPELQEVVSKAEKRLSRKYNEESDIGNLFTDILRKKMGTDLAFFNSGGIRADLPEGDITVADMLDAFPFQDRIWKLELTGKQVKKVLEQGFSFDRGILQCSGLRSTYDVNQAIGQRLQSLSINGQEVQDTDRFSASLPGVIAEGADLYTTFPEAKVLAGPGPYFADLLEEYLRETELVKVPERGRMVRN